MKKVSATVISVILVSVIGLNLVYYVQQPRMLFFPTRDMQKTPKDWGLAYEDVYLDSSNGNRIHGWFMPNSKSNRAILFFHGNGGNISHRGDSLVIFSRLGLNVLIVDYQGYGNSEGRPGEQEFNDDAHAAFRELTEKRGFIKENIVVFGRSLGGAVASRLAAETQPGTVILESTFSSISDMAARFFPLMSKFVVQRYHFNTIEQVRKINSPVLVLHSRSDEIIPFASGEQVYLAANKPKLFVEMTGDHNNGFLNTQPGYEQVLAKFLEISKQNP